METTSAELVLGVEPDAAARGRRLLASAVPGSPVLEDAQLVVTELLTNAQLHGAPPLRLRVDPQGDGGLRVEVSDASRDLPLLPAASLDAMTGRGLALVRALCTAWGVEPREDGKTVWAELREGAQPEQVAPDLDALLDAWDDEADAEPLHRIELGAVPTRMLLEAKRHIDNVVRELALEQAPGFQALVEAATRDFALARDRIKRQAAEASARGDLQTDLVLELPVSSVAGGERYLRALDEADRHAREARMLTLEAPPLHKLFRRWYVGAVIERLRAAAGGQDAQPVQPFSALLADEVAELSSLREAAHRLAVLQAVNAELASARTAEEMADAVLRRCVEELDALSVRAYVVEGVTLRSVAATGGTAEVSGAVETIPLAAELPGPVALRGARTLVLRDRADAVQRFPAMAGLLHSDRGLLVVPLLAGTQRVGVLSLGLPPDSRVPHDERGAFVQALADALAQALDRVQGPRTVPDAVEGLDHAALFRQLPTAYMVMDRDLVLIEANEAYLASVGRSREDILGRWVFDAFPPSPDALEPGTGVSRIQRSFERARDTGRVDVLPVQKYDIPDPVGGGMVERYWSLISVPVPGPDGRVAFVAQRAEDVTDFVQERERGKRAEQAGEAWRRRAEEVEADLFARGAELDTALAERDRSARELAGLAALGLGLASAESEEALATVVFDVGVPVLGADGGAVAVRDDAAGVLRLQTSASLRTHLQDEYAQIPLDAPLPMARAARTGSRLLPGEDLEPEHRRALERVGHASAVHLPLRVGEQLLGALALTWRTRRDLTPGDLALLDGFAAQVSQALQRLLARQAQQESARAAERMSETLQRSLLTAPPPLPGVELAVRYRPAAARAHVGGDWYDAFVPAQGGAVLAIGDVTGHDRVAAAAMGQLRNLLRGLAYDSPDGPARLLSRLDAAVQGLDLGVLATAVLARLEPAERGVRLRWSSAGHPPGLVRDPAGGVRLLEERGELMLGVAPGTPRSDAVLDLVAGSTLVLFTDGLVERRDRGLDQGLAELRAALIALPDDGPEATADALLATVDEDANTDDIALLVLRVR